MRILTIIVDAVPVDEIKSIIPKDETLTPGILYVGVATLAGSIIARPRMCPFFPYSPELSN